MQAKGRWGSAGDPSTSLGLLRKRPSFSSPSTLYERADPALSPVQRTMGNSYNLSEPEFPSGEVGILLHALPSFSGQLWDSEPCDAYSLCKEREKSYSLTYMLPSHLVPFVLCSRASLRLCCGRDQLDQSTDRGSRPRCTYFLFSLAFVLCQMTLMLFLPTCFTHSTLNGIFGAPTYITIWRNKSPYKPTEEWNQSQVLGLGQNPMILQLQVTFETTQANPCLWLMKKWRPDHWLHVTPQFSKKPRPKSHDLLLSQRLKVIASIDTLSFDFFSECVWIYALISSLPDVTFGPGERNNFLVVIHKVSVWVVSSVWVLES